MSAVIVSESEIKRMVFDDLHKFHAAVRSVQLLLLVLFVVIGLCSATIFSVLRTTEDDVDMNMESIEVNGHFCLMK
jgi:hypothetical protein